MARILYGKTLPDYAIYNMKFRNVAGALRTLHAHPARE